MEVLECGLALIVTKQYIPQKKRTSVGLSEHRLWPIVHSKQTSTSQVRHRCCQFGLPGSSTMSSAHSQRGNQGGVARLQNPVKSTVEGLPPYGGIYGLGVRVEQPKSTFTHTLEFDPFDVLQFYFG